MYLKRLRLAVYTCSCYLHISQSSPRLWFGLMFHDKLEKVSANCLKALKGYLQQHWQLVCFSAYKMNYKKRRTAESFFNL